MMVGYKNSPAEPISLAELEREYCRVTQQSYPIQEMEFARSWMLFRVRHRLHIISPLRVGDSVCPCLVRNTVLTFFLLTFFPFQLAVIVQGITARRARRQASSEQAHLYADKISLMGELARRVLEDEGHVLPLPPKSKVRPKL